MFTSDEDDDIEEFIMANISENTHLISDKTPIIQSGRKHSLNLDTGLDYSNSMSSVANNIDASATSNEESEYEIYSSPVRRTDISNNNCEKLKSTSYVWILASFAAIGGFLFGYDTGVVSGAMLLLKDEFNLSSFEQELVVSITIATAFLSALLGGYFNDKFGRKPVTIFASLVFAGGAVVLGIAKNVEMLIIGRAILGIGIGLASMTVPVYIAESAPSHLRGQLVTTNNLFITGGQCIASILAGGFSYLEENGWRYMLGLAALPAVIQFIGFLFLPESPRWLMRRGYETRARDVLNKLRATSDVDKELNEMKLDFQIEQEGHNSGNNDEPTILRILKTPAVRRAVIIGCSLQLFQQLSGINTVMYYSASIIRMAGISDNHLAIWLAAVTGSVNFLFTVVGVFLVDRIGRRKLLLGSLIGVVLSLILLAVAFQLAAFNSPHISRFDLNHTNSSCSDYSYCESCIQDKDCGFCFTGSGGSANGSCLSVDPDDESQSKYGACGKNAHSGNIWAPSYCPSDYSWLAILGLMLYLVFFAPGMGPMPWTINSEIYPLWARSTGNSLSAATNWISNLAVSMTFLTLTETLTKYGTYWLFVGLTFIGLCFFTAFLPETKGQKLEQVEDLFQRPWCSRNKTTPGDSTQYSHMDSRKS